MPFKTKRQKMRAEKRLLEFVEAQKFSYISSKKKGEKSPAVGISTQETDKINAATRLTIENNYSFARNELVKIAILASVIIGFQIILRVTGITF